MRVGIDVENKKEAELIRAGLSDPATRALVKVLGVLLSLPSDRARSRVLTHVTDLLDEEAEYRKNENKRKEISE